MEKSKIREFNKLQLDLVEYMFIEWLCRRGVFSAFRSNFKSVRPFETSFRSALRDQIRSVLSTSDLAVGDLISGSFSFAKTSEGFTFWADISSAWRRFCSNFRTLF